MFKVFYTLFEHSQLKKIKNSFGENLGGGEKLRNTNQTKKNKLRIHMNTNIFLF